MIAAEKNNIHIHTSGKYTIMNHKKQLAIWVGSLFFAAISAKAADFTPRLELEGQTYSGEVSGGMGVFLPLVTEAGQAVFMDVRQNTLRHGGNQTSVGLGYRFLGADEVVYGANLYGDFMKSAQKNRFSRVSVGLEALGPVFEARANVYVPTGTKERAVSQRLSTTVAADDYLYLQHHRTGEKIRRGVDAEVGGRLPIFAADSNQQLKAFVGGYWFNDSQSSNLVGAKTRLEWATHKVSFMPKNVGLSLGAMASYDNKDHLKGGAMVRLSLSLGQSNVGGAAAQDRLLQRVERERHIRTEQTQHLLSERAADASGKVMGKVVVLNEGAASMRAATTMSQRVAEAGENGVILVAGDVVLNDTLTLSQGQQLHGGQTLTVVGSESGMTAEHRFANKAGSLTGLDQTRDVVTLQSGSSVQQLAIKGGLSGISAQNADKVTIAGVSVNGSKGNGIQLDNVNGAVMHNVTIHNVGQDGIVVNQGRNIDIKQVDISKTGHDGIRLTQVQGANIDQANIHDLAICDNNTECEFAVAGDPNRVPFAAISAWGTSNLNVTNTKIADTTYGVFVGSAFDRQDYEYAIKDLAQNITLENVSINNTRREGVILVGANNVALNQISIDNAARQENGQYDMDLVVIQATSDVSIKNMDLKGGVNGLMLVTSPNLQRAGKTERVTVDGLNVSGTSRSGVFFNPVSDVTLKNVTIDKAKTYGMFMFGSDWSGAVENIRFENVKINGAKDAGIYAVGPLNNITGDVTVADTAIVCESQKWGGADVSQPDGAAWLVNGEAVSTERFQNQCG